MKAKRMANGDIQVRMTRKEMSLIKDLAILLTNERNVTDTIAKGDIYDTHVSAWLSKELRNNLLDLALCDANL